MPGPERGRLLAAARRGESELFPGPGVRAPSSPGLKTSYVMVSSPHELRGRVLWTRTQLRSVSRQATAPTRPEAAKYRLFT